MKRIYFKVINSNIYKLVFTLSLLLFVTLTRADAQDSLKVIRGEAGNNSWLRFTDASNALYHHLAGQAYDLLDQRSDEVARFQSLSNWQARQQEVKKTLGDIVGPFPAKTPLNAQVTRTLDKKNYRVEHIVYESQPGFHVTSTLFLPKNIDQPAPAVIYASGHTSEGYRSTTYQHVILNLVNKGFIVFAFDPVSQGERLQYYDSQEGESVIGGATNEHSYAGGQAFITGSSQASYMIWDGIRAIDYLTSRKEIDPSRIGITGRSGGGTQAAYIAAFDERIAAVAPENYITNFTRLLQSIGPQDAEQNLPTEIARGIDHADLLAGQAPRPTLMITTTRDFFSIQGARETADEVSKIYQMYGKKENFGMVEDDTTHASTLKNREAMYGFFQRHLNNPGSQQDEKVTLLTEEELQVTRTGQVSNSLGGETVFSLNRKHAGKLIDTLQIDRKDLEQHLPKAVKAAQKLSGFRRPDSVAKPVFAGRFQKDGYAIEKYFVMGEGGDYPIPYLLLVPDQPNGKGLIYLNPSSKDARLQQKERLATNGYTVLTPDLLGVGEMGGSDYRGDSYIKDANYNLWFASILVGRSIVGIQAGDVVRLAQLLRKRRDIKEVYGLARRQMGPTLLHAAAFEPVISRVALFDPNSSYRSIVMNRFYDPAVIPGTVAGALSAYDLPDLAASLAPRKLLMTGLKDGSGNPADSATFKKDTAVIKAAYQQNNAAGQLKIIPSGSGKELLMDWIK